MEDNWFTFDRFFLSSQIKWRNTEIHTCYEMNNSYLLAPHVARDSDNQNVLVMIKITLALEKGRPKSVQKSINSIKNYWNVSIFDKSNVSRRNQNPLPMLLIISLENWRY